MNNKTKSRIGIYAMITLSIIFYVYEFLLRNLPGVLVHEYRDIWHFNTAQIGLIDSAYYWGYTPMQPFVGAIVDYFGVRPSMLAAIILCAIGCFFFNQEQHYNLVVLSRFVIGFGSAFAFISVLKLANEWLEPRYTNFVAGLTTALGKASAFGGMTLMTTAVMALTSDVLLTILCGIGLCIFVLAYYAIYDSQETINDDHPSIFNGVTRALCSPQIWLNGIIGGALYLHTMLFSNLWGIVFMQKAYDYDQVIATHIAAITFLGWALGGPITGLLVARYGHRRQWVIISSLLATIVFCVIIYVPINNIMIQNSLCFLLGLVSSPQVLIFTLAKDTLPKQYAGSAMAVTNMLVMIGGFLGAVIGGMIQIDSSIADLQRALMIIPIATSIAFLMSFMLEDKEYQ